MTKRTNPEYYSDEELANLKGTVNALTVEPEVVTPLDPDNPEPWEIPAKTLRQHRGQVSYDILAERTDLAPTCDPPDRYYDDPPTDREILLNTNYSYEDVCLVIDTLLLLTPEQYTVIHMLYTQLQAGETLNYSAVSRETGFARSRVRKLIDEALAAVPALALSKIVPDRALG